jgi:hypothetical protein
MIIDDTLFNHLISGISIFNRKENKEPQRDAKVFSNLPPRRKGGKNAKRKELLFLTIVATD